VDPRTGAVRYAPNLRWRDFPLRARLEEAVDLPVWVLNDVQAATYGEWLHGAGRGAEHLVTLFVGTGIGGGVVLDGRLIHGCDGTAGEIGHMKIDRAGPQCTCGRQGCLEAYAGGWAIARRAREALQDEAGRGSVLLEAAGGRADAVTAETVSAAYHLGDPLAARLVEEIAVALATGVASVVSGFNPCLVILGGGVIEGIPALVSLIRTEVAARALEVPAASVRIVTAALGRHAGAVGAAAWARHGGGTARGNPPP
jgi:glucokinase